MKNPDNTQSFTLTEHGKRIAELVRKQTEIDIDEITDIRNFLNSLTGDELILFTCVLYPEYSVNSEITDRILKNRIRLSISLYKKGKVDLEMAAHLAGLPIEKYLDEIPQYR